MIEKTSIEIYKNGVKVFVGLNQCKQKHESLEIPTRGVIEAFSGKSMQRLAWIYSQGLWASMITLTYHIDFPSGVESKKHLDIVLKRITYDGYKYLWVVEFQGRGYPHYHIWIDSELETEQWHKYIRSWLNCTEQYNSSESAKKFHLHEKTYTKWNVRLDLNYAAKYAQKQKQKWLPIGIETFGRWWGSSRNVIIPERTVEVEFNKENPLDVIYEKCLTQFRRNVKRAIFHWSRRKKLNRFDRKTNTGFTYILNDHRKECIDKLYDYAEKNFESLQKEHLDKQ